jgi:GNAT superfamily N-acetyltransferase
MISNFDDPRLLDWITGECRAGHVCVIEVGGEPVAMMMLADDEIQYVAVTASNRRRGLGPRLVAHAQGARPKLIAKVDEENRHSQRMLASAGFLMDQGKTASKTPGRYWLTYRWQRKLARH